MDLRLAGKRALVTESSSGERIRADRPMQDPPLGFVMTLTSAITDMMIREPAKAEAQSRVAFDAMR